MTPALSLEARASHTFRKLPPFPEILEDAELTWELIRLAPSVREKRRARLKQEYKAYRGAQHDARVGLSSIASAEKRGVGQSTIRAWRTGHLPLLVAALLGDGRFGATIALPTDENLNFAYFLGACLANRDANSPFKRSFSYCCLDDDVVDTLKRELTSLYGPDCYTIEVPSDHPAPELNFHANNLFIDLYKSTEGYQSLPWKYLGTLAEKRAFVRGFFDLGAVVEVTSHEGEPYIEGLYVTRRFTQNRVRFFEELALVLQDLGTYPTVLSFNDGTIHHLAVTDRDSLQVLLDQDLVPSRLVPQVEEAVRVRKKRSHHILRVYLEVEVLRERYTQELQAQGRDPSEPLSMKKDAGLFRKLRGIAQREQASLDTVQRFYRGVPRASPVIRHYHELGVLRAKYRNLEAVSVLCRMYGFSSAKAREVASQYPSFDTFTSSVAVLREYGLSDVRMKETLAKGPAEITALAKRYEDAASDPAYRYLCDVMGLPQDPALQLAHDPLYQHPFTRSFIHFGMEYATVPEQEIPGILALSSPRKKTPSKDAIYAYLDRHHPLHIGNFVMTYSALEHLCKMDGLDPTTLLSSRVWRETVDHMVSHLPTQQPTYHVREKQNGNGNGNGYVPAETSDKTPSLVCFWNSGGYRFTIRPASESEQAWGIITSVASLPPVQTSERANHEQGESNGYEVDREPNGEGRDTDHQKLRPLTRDAVLPLIDELSELPAP